MNPINMIEAIHLALHDAMLLDENVVVLGEDVAVNGGVFRATTGLLETFGSRRVMDTPLAESLIAGMSLGMASQGLRPVAEIQFMGFMYATFEHLISHASRLRHRTRGRLTCPMVLRTPFGAGIHAPEHHSESTEAMLCHVPGLKVVVPSSPTRAYGLLLSAILSNDPVIFLEPSRLYRDQKAILKTRNTPLPLDTCFTLREGHDLTLITWGSMVKECLEVTDKLAQKNISIELIDVGTLKPLDFETIQISIQKTKHAVIVHEAPQSGGWGAEISSRIHENLFNELKSPVLRVTAPDIVVPYFQQEWLYIPNTQDIEKAIYQSLRR
jgi:2-oxoisovalerate dehydrogenase E1 component beta subunit